MNKEKVIEIIKNLIGIIVIIYCIRIGEQFMLPSGVIGIGFDYIDNEYPQITKIVQNSPVSSTDIAINDVIISVDEEDIKNKSKSYILRKIRGKVNTPVVLLIKNNSELKKYTITRIKRKINWFPF